MVYIRRLIILLQRITNQADHLVMAMPFLGRIAIGLVGLIVVAVGLYQIYQGFRAGFERQFQTYALTPKEAKLATDVGRFGTAARGVVFALVGV